MVLGGFAGIAWSHYANGAEPYRRSLVDVAELIAKRSDLQRRVAELNPEATLERAATMIKDVDHLRGEVGALKAAIESACAPLADPAANPTTPVEATPPKDAAKDPAAQADTTSPTPSRPSPTARRAVNNAFDALYSVFWAMEERYPPSTGATPSGRHTPLVEAGKSQISRAMTTLGLLENQGTVWQCENLLGNSVLSNTGESDKLAAGFEELQLALSAQARRESEQRTALEQELVNHEKRIVEAQKNLEVSTKHTVVTYMPFAMLIILAFGVVYFFAAQSGKESVVYELVLSGQLIQFPTVVILFALILVLALADAIEPDQTGTLVAGVAGYVLSQGIGRMAASKARPRGAGGGSTEAGEGNADPKPSSTATAPKGVQGEQPQA